MHQLQTLGITFLLLITSQISFCQTFSEEIRKIRNEEIVLMNHEVKGYEELLIALEILKQYRSAALNSLSTGDIKNFESYVSVDLARFSSMFNLYIFSITEWEVLLILRGDYSGYFRNVENRFHLVTSTERYRNSTPNSFFFPMRDSFGIGLAQYIRSNRDRIIQQVSNAKISSEQRDFIMVSLENYLYESNYCDLQQKEVLIGKATKFESEYKGSDLSNFSEQVFSVEFEDSGFAIGGFIGSGIFLPDRNLSKFFSPSIPILGSAEVYYQRLIISAGLGTSLFQRIRQDFYKDTTWMAGDNSGISTGEISLSYNLIESNKGNIAPVIGLRGLGIYAPSKERYENIGNLLSSSSVNYGFNIDWKWNNKGCEQGVNRKAAFKKSYNALRLGFSYQNPRFQQSVPDLSGSMYLIRISIGAYQHFAKKLK